MKKIIKSESGLQDVAYLGLSRLATQCYIKLWEHSYYMFVTELADAVGRSPSNLYPALRQLEQYGLLSRLKVPGYKPTSFRARAVEEAFDVFIAEKHKQVLLLMQRQRRERPLAE